VSPSLFRLARPYDARVLAKERMRADISARAFPRISPALATSRRSPGAVCDEEPTTGDQLLSRPLRVKTICSWTDATGILGQPIRAGDTRRDRVSEQGERLTRGADQLRPVGAAVPDGVHGEGMQLVHGDALLPSLRER